MVKYEWVVILVTIVSAVIVDGEERVSSLESAVVNSPTYSATVRKYKTKLLKQCKSEITVTGKGIGEVYTVPCSVYGLNIITTDRVLVVHNRDKRHALVLYSDTKSVLIEYFGDYCSKNTFKTMNGKTTSTLEDMSTQSCKTVLDKVALEERKAKKPLKEAKRKIKLAFQKMFPPEFFEALKTDKPVDNTYSSGWNSWGSR